MNKSKKLVMTVEFETHDLLQEVNEICELAGKLKDKIYAIESKSRNITLKGVPGVADTPN